MAVAAFAATTACGGGDDRLGEELPPVRISSVSTSTTSPTTTDLTTTTDTPTTSVRPTTSVADSLVVPATTTPTPTSSDPPPTTLGDAPAPATTSAPATTPTTTAASGGSNGSGDGPGTITGGATVGGGAGRGGVTPADRVETPVLLTWVGGSDVVDDELSLPAAAAARMGRIDDRPVEVRAVTDVDPDLARIGQLVAEAVDDGAVGLIVAISPTLAAYGGTGDCDDVTPDAARIACLLEPPVGSELDEREAELQQLVDDIVASGRPAFVYISGVSSQSLDDAELGADITTAEATIASVDPADTSVSFGTASITRGVTGADEGTAFVDALTPSASGVELLADLLTPDIEAFFEQQLG